MIGSSAGDPRDRRPDFDPEILDRTVISIPLLSRFAEEQRRRRADPQRPVELYDLVVDLNLEHASGRDAVRRTALELITQATEATGATGATEATGATGTPAGVDMAKSEYSRQYLFVRLSRAAIRELVRLSGARGPIHRIWPDFQIKAQLNKSVSTVKADAARVSFNALGKDVVWAVLDSGVEATHPHFRAHGNVSETADPQHRDFTGTGPPTKDAFGHGTHVAGIIAGELRAAAGRRIEAVTRHRDESGDVVHEVVELPEITGMAPQCRLLSLKVLDDDGAGRVSGLIAAIEYLQEINGYGRRLRVHGVNISVGYDFEPEWFACGQSPLCVEVDRLVRSGVVVVVAAGNTGYGWLSSASRGTVPAGMSLTINDPGNAELAITVGATHREMPHVYGVSYFSSKGPTGDGRDKPDLVAPGEKIVSCAAGRRRAGASGAAGGFDYVEDSGTSMAAPHVSGVIAAFLSVRREFIGRPEEVKQIFLSTATDLRRDRHFQGRGLVDFMRAIQSV